MRPYSVGFSGAAVSDLWRIRDHISADSRSAADRVAAQIVAACDALRHFPRRGRSGILPGTRELTIMSPYVIVYRIDEAEERVEILRIWHGAQER